VKNKIELLAPGGDVNSIKAAIVAGADAIYCGLDKFNARNRAENISFENLQGIIRLAHENNCKIFLTLNIIILDNEIPAIITLLNRLINTNIDGVIIQDLGLFYILSKHFKELEIHASTQLTTHNQGQILFLSKLTATRVNLSRELNIEEIKELSSFGHKNNVLTEVFVHGSYCISFSGVCYMSSVNSGKSGNRGMCSQPCRDKYETTAQGKDYPLNLKDNSAYFNLAELYNAGVSSLKIEGRIKEFEYVYTVVNSWRKQINSFNNTSKLLTDNSELYTVFNRDFSNSFLTGEIDKDMYIDNPMSYSTKYHSEKNNYKITDKITEEQLKLYNEKEKTRAYIKSKIDLLNIDKIPLTITISGEKGEVLKTQIKTPETSFIVLSETKLEKTGTQVLDRKMVLKRFKAFNETEYYIENILLEKLEKDVFISFKELTSIKKRILFLLNNSKEVIAPVDIPKIKKQASTKIEPSLSVLISSIKDVYLCEETEANIYFQLPSNFKNKFSEVSDIFRNNKRLIPWFPSILIGEDYTIAKKFIEELQPKIIVTNNTGIAYEAYKNDIAWIAGPYLNNINSYSLLALKEKFNCSGAFISNEINEFQIKSIKKPDDFKMYYSIYHPIVMMTSRQCFFHQVTGCAKHKIDNTCISHCVKSATITNLKKQTSFIEKSEGNYHRIYNEHNFLNTDIVTNITNKFSSFFIDLSNIETKTEINLNKIEIIKLFENLINQKTNSKEELLKVFHNTTDSQYKKGL